MQWSLRDSVLDRLERPDDLASLEEVSVTFQVGLVGTDGVILASDQQASFAGEHIQTSSLTRKIFWNVSREIACAASGNDGIAGHIAADLVRTTTVPRDADEGLVYELLQTRIDELWRKYVPKKYDGTPDRNPDSCLLVALPKNPYHLWRIFAISSNSSRTAFRDKAQAGDHRNPAKYFLDRFYELRSVTELIGLAAHAVCEAGALNPRWISGLDLLVWRFEEREPRLYEGLETEELKKRASRLADQISESLRGDNCESED